MMLTKRLRTTQYLVSSVVRHQVCINFPIVVQASGPESVAVWLPIISRVSGWLPREITHSSISEADKASIIARSSLFPATLKIGKGRAKVRLVH